MPKNCCVPLCKSNASRNPELCYHELPSKENLRNAWLRNISREGTDKGSHWQPSSRTVVCSLHFNADDYKVGMKRKLLLPTAVPTQFPSYPTYMLPSRSKERKTHIRVPRGERTEANISGKPVSVTEERKTKRLRLEEFDAESADSQCQSQGRSISPCQPQENIGSGESTGHQEHLQSGLKHEECQTTFDLVGYIAETKRNAHRLEVKVQRLNERLQELQKNCDEFREKVAQYEKNRAVQALKALSTAAQEGDRTANFVMEQIINFDKTRPTWQEPTLRECVLWKATSCKSYDHVRGRKLLKLPCRSTLQKFVGSSTGETGVTSLIRERLRVERQGLRSEKEPYCSLIIDEMSIQQKVIYDRQVDRIFGLVDIDCERQAGGATEIANRLLCFVLRGLSTAYVIPVGYFFTRNIKHDRLRSLTLNVLKAVEEAGFFIVRIVTDNHQTNTAMFRGMSDDNTLQHVVPHPVRENDPLFLSFDPNHLIKNLRTNLLEREMFDGTEKIRGGSFLKALYEIQQNLLVKPARLLSRSHVEPNNLEKMKVSRATLVFSPAVISSLEFLQKNPKAHERASEFRDCGSTITFMKTVGKWYDLHDISGWKSRQRPFVTSEDDRLAWLEVDFIGYLEDIKLESAKCRAKSLTKETYEATIMTTRSTVAVVEYLLNDVGFKYALTRALNSDPVESLFSCFRQFNGGNDRVDARTAVFTAEKLLKVGILEAARSGNAPSSSECQTALKFTSTHHGARIPAIPDEALAVLWKTQHVMKYDEVPVQFDFTALVYLAGYLAFVCEEKVTCPACKLQLKGKTSREGAYQFVFSLDQGGLSYPPT
ncbi:hypothetical protein MTO96_021122 [Rhipicephalus appendiculatus]